MTLLSPLGTARQRLQPGAAGVIFPLDLLPALREADLGSEALYLAWQVAAWAPALPPAEGRALMSIVVRSLIAAAHGSTRLPVDQGARALLAKIPDVVGTSGERRPLIIEGTHLYHQKLLAREDHVAAWVRALAARRAAWDAAAIDDALALIGSNWAPRLTTMQVGAVRLALGNKLAVITGGPGTGKTTVVLAILRSLGRLGVPASSIALAAPTGRSAMRLQEAIKAGLHAVVRPAAEDQALLADPPSAQTLHRLLGYSPRSGTFGRHRNNRLPAKVVIVDEGSMIDLLLMDRLLGALADDAALVLLGDADQLPSVQAGAVFRDLADQPPGAAAFLAVARLTQSHRVDPTQSAGRQILQVAASVQRGDAAAVQDQIPDRASVEAIAWQGVERVGGEAREELLRRWYGNKIAALPGRDSLIEAAYPLAAAGFSPADETSLNLLHAHYQRFRVLALTRARPTGALAANSWLHAAGADPLARFAAGQPIMMLHNDYDRDLYNGDQGLIMRVAERGQPARLMAVFPVRGRWAAWDVESLQGSIEHSFAMTVHKAQGSEFDDVLLLLPGAASPLMNRELLYTAITRSRRSVVVCGEAAELSAGVAVSLVRSSGLGEKIGFKP